MASTDSFVMTLYNLVFVTVALAALAVEFVVSINSMHERTALASSLEHMAKSFTEIKGIEDTIKSYLPAAAVIGSLPQSDDRSTRYDTVSSMMWQRVFDGYSKGYKHKHLMQHLGATVDRAQEGTAVREIIAVLNEPRLANRLLLEMDKSTITICYVSAVLEMFGSMENTEPAAWNAASYLLSEEAELLAALSRSHMLVLRGSVEHARSVLRDWLASQATAAQTTGRNVLERNFSIVARRLYVLSDAIVMRLETRIRARGVTVPEVAINERILKQLMSRYSESELKANLERYDRAPLQLASYLTELTTVLRRANAADRLDYRMTKIFGVDRVPRIIDTLNEIADVPNMSLSRNMRYYLIILTARLTLELNHKFRREVVTLRNLDFASLFDSCVDSTNAITRLVKHRSAAMEARDSYLQGASFSLQAIFETAMTPNGLRLIEREENE